MDEPRNAALEAAIHADPYDAAAYSVYADWLETVGSPRGQWIALSFATDPKSQKLAAELREAHRDLLVGPLDELAQRESTRSITIEVRWRFGFAHTARIDVDLRSPDHTSDTAVLDRFFAHPTTRFLAELRLYFPHYGDAERVAIEPIVAAIAQRSHPALRVLQIGQFKFDPRSTNAGNYRQDHMPHRLGDLGALWTAVPALRTLALGAGYFELGDVALPELRKVSLHAIEPGVCAAIAKQHWPAIELLEIASAPSFAELAPVFAAHQPKRLGLISTRFTDELCRRLPALPGTRELDLSLGCLTDKGARRFAANPNVRGLDILDASSNFLSKDGVAALGPVANRIVGDRQRIPVEYPAIYYRR